ncbi:hypothetical protein ACMGOD_004379 [Klebsiella oxytoca]
MLLKPLLIWFAFIPLAAVNAAVRELVLTPLAGEEIALPVSGVVLILLIFAVSYFFLPKTTGTPWGKYWFVGFLWAMLTILFETVLGLSLKKTIHEIISDYDISTGNLWLLIVLSLIFIPRLVLVLRTHRMSQRAER